MLQLTKKIFLPFLLILLAIPFSLGQVDVDLKSQFYCALTPGNVEIDITNNLNETDTFLMTFTGKNRDWVYARKSYVKLSPGETGHLSILVLAPENTKSGKYFLNLNFKGLESGWSDDRDLCLTVLKNYNAIIEKVETTKKEYEPGEIVRTHVTVSNIGTKDFDDLKITATLNGDDTHIKKSKEISLESDIKKTVTLEFKTGKYSKPGTYNINYELQGVGKTLGKEKETIDIKKVVDFDTSSYESWTPLASFKKVSITNKGNIKATKNIQFSVPKIWSFLVTTDLEPEIKSSGDEITYSWDITLDPKESKEVGLQINYWPIILIFIAIVYLFFLILLRLRKMKVVKRIVSKKDNGEMTVAIDIKNKSLEKVKNVKIKDSVPSIGKVVRKSVNVKPEIEKMKTKTKLEWNLGNLKRGDERLITYRIKPTLENIESLKLPGVEVKGETKKGKKIKIFSRELEISENKEKE